MRSFDKEKVQEQFDELIESVQEEGAFSVQFDGKEVAVFLPPALYEALLKSAQSSSLVKNSGATPLES